VATAQRFEHFSPAAESGPLFQMADDDAEEGATSIELQLSEGSKLTVYTDKSGLKMACYHPFYKMGHLDIDHSVACQPGCPLCSIGIPAAFVMLVPAVDMATQSPGHIRFYADAQVVPDVPVTLPPHLRYRVKPQGKFAEPIRLMLSHHQAPRRQGYQIHVLNKKTVRALETKPPAHLLNTLDLLLDQAVATLDAASTRLLERLATPTSAEELRQVPAVANALRFHGFQV
jgi:hypothetical protein